MIHSLKPASQVEVGCPWARGLQPQLQPKGEEPLQAYQPAPQQQAHPPPPLAKPKGPLGRKTGARGLGAAELHARGPKPKEPNPTAAPKVAEVSAMQPAVWIRRRWS